MSMGRYAISSGLLEVFSYVDGENERCVYETHGYAGRNQCKNSPACISRRGVGPLPVGRYLVTPVAQHPGLGPDVLALEPDATNVMFGRSGFYIHGDSRQHPGNSSSGCIILPRSSRMALIEFHLSILDVVPGLPSEARGLEQRT
jgi:hypothetical protein